MKHLFSIIVVVIAFLLGSCNKSPVCETWDISHECKSTDPRVYGCNGSISYMTVKLCGTQLDEAHAGKDKEVETSPGVKQITHYIKRVQ